MNNGKVSGGESRKHQIMVKERGDNNIVKKQQTEPRVAEISTSNVRQAVEDSKAVSHIGDTGKVKFSSCRSLKKIEEFIYLSSIGVQCFSAIRCMVSQ